jgi:hypothetical protein
MDRKHLAQWRALAAAVCVSALAGCGGGGGDADTAAGTETSVSATHAQAAELVGSASSWVAPSTLADLSGWKLTLPTDAYGGTGGIGGIQYPAVTLNPDKLVAGYMDAHFHGDAQGRIVFVAPANGAVTTPGSGSNHTRSELREYFQGAGADAAGYWTSGTGTLNASCDILSTASTARTIIIGQLRTAQRNLALIVYRPDLRKVGVDVYASNAEGSTHAITWLKSNVGLGQRLTYSLSLQGGRLTATVNGVNASFVTDGSWAGSGLAFKIGAYHTVPNTGNPPDAVTTLACASFSVSH